MCEQDGVFPDGFYSTTNLATQVRLDGRWVRGGEPGDGLLTKLADRGSSQAKGIVTDVGLFLEQLNAELAPDYRARV